MDAIKSYVDNVFANLPKNNAVLKAKTEMLANMEEKYLAFKQEGFSEHEAVGRVISEFGNIDELLTELELKPSGSGSAKKVRQISREEALEWLAQKRRSGFLIALGVLMCIAAPAALIFVNYLGFSPEWPGCFENAAVSPALGVTLMLLIVAAAVGIFIYSGMRLEKFRFMEKEFALPAHLQKEIEEHKNAFSGKYTIAVMSGVMLCILAPLVIILPLLLFDTSAVAPLWVVLMLLLIAAAVFLFVYFGSIHESYEMILKLGEYSEEPKDKLINAVTSVIWPLAVMIYLLAGFLGGHWGSAWLVFPVAAFVSIIIQVIIKAIKKD
jgi:hypothetical protein